MKYGTWNVSPLNREMTAGLMEAGISPLVAAVLVSRGFDTPEKAGAFLASCSMPLSDPFELPDMEQAAARVRLALRRGERIAVYGDYDVDGITSTCLLTDFLTKYGADCIWYIPARLEEGYGLNEPAIRQLKQQGTDLIITVDCGITAVEEAELCHELGIDLIITDHHICREQLPRAIAVVDPHRTDCSCSFDAPAGVGVAFKLAAAVCGDQDYIMQEYCDLVALGTIADVMPLTGENRTLVAAGVEAARRHPRAGILALLNECQLSPDALNSSVMGYTLAPRINAAGRMGQVELAEELFLTSDPDTAAALAAQLCDLNRQRQAIEAGIYAEASAMLQGTANPDAIVLSGENWHQGVVGIVVSRLAEEYGCPVFLICLSSGNEVGKASSRSFGGFPLLHALDQLQALLTSYGGHELAAGFSIRRECIPAFRQQVTALAHTWRQAHPEGSALELDCSVSPSMLTVSNVADLSCLEPFGAAFPRPVFHMQGLQIEHLTTVGGGRHLKLRFTTGRSRTMLDAIFFSASASTAAVAPGDVVEAAFTPQINDFRGLRSVQLNLTDLRPSEECRRHIESDRQIYARFASGGISAAEALSLIPQRNEFAAVWRYLSANSIGPDSILTDEFCVLSRKIARSVNRPVSFVRTRVCLDVLEERGLIHIERGPKTICIRLTPGKNKVDLQASEILLRLKNTQGR